MRILPTPLHQCFLIEPTIHSDTRGYFFESFNKQTFAQLSGLNVDFVQDNQALSHYGTLRGLHFQQGVHAQAKLVRVISGSVLDVVVDLRPTSPTFLQHYSVVLNATNQLQLFVPRGFAHGYSVLADHTLFFYKCDNYYHKASEGGLYYADPQLAIDWQLPPHSIQLSEKDQTQPLLSELLK